MSRTLVTCVLLLMVRLAAPAWASTAGPDRFHMLGWEPRERKVCWEIESFDETGKVPVIYCSRAVADTLSSAQPVRWSVGVTYHRPGRDSLHDEYAERRTRLVSRLRTLQPRFYGSFERLRTSIVAADSVRLGGASEAIPRFRLRVEGLFRVGGDAFEVETFHLPEVRCLATYPLPDHSGELAVIAFLGKSGWRDEWGSECQMAIPVRRSRDGHWSGAIPTYKWTRVP